MAAKKKTVKKARAARATKKPVRPKTSAKPAASSNTKSAAREPSGRVRAPITPFLWFNGAAEDAARFYTTLFEGSKVLSVQPGPNGKAMSVVFQLGGQKVMALNGGPHYALSPAFSFFVDVDTQDEVDFLWSALTSNGGKESMCGWLEDRYGVSWQIIPKALMKLLWHKDAKKAQRAMDAMLKMRKIVIADLEAAARG